LGGGGDAPAAAAVGITGSLIAASDIVLLLVRTALTVR